MVEVNDILTNFLNNHKDEKINIFLGYHDFDDGMLIVINGTLLDFDNKFLQIKDEDEKEMVISLNHVRYISEGWSGDLVRIEEKGSD